MANRDQFKRHEARISYLIALKKRNPIAFALLPSASRPLNAASRRELHRVVGEMRDCGLFTGHSREQDPWYVRRLISLLSDLPVDYTYQWER